MPLGTGLFCRIVSSSPSPIPNTPLSSVPYCLVSMPFFQSGAATNVSSTNPSTYFHFSLRLLLIPSHNLLSMRPASRCGSLCSSLRRVRSSGSFARAVFSACLSTSSSRSWTTLRSTTTADFSSRTASNTPT